MALTPICRLLGILSLVLLLFHTLFVLINLPTHPLTPHVSLLALEHGARLRHLNSTLTLLRSDMQALNATLHEHYREITQTLDETKNTVSISRSNGMSSAPVLRKTRALLFTMDSMDSYEQAASRGGAAGEILVRRSLEEAFRHFHVQLDVARSDGDFESRRLSDYDIIVLDPWTWAAPGNLQSIFTFIDYM
jgi:hypothetical protein